MLLTELLCFALGLKLAVGTTCKIIVFPSNRGIAFHAAADCVGHARTTRDPVYLKKKDLIATDKKAL